jgi:hypothetical protein
MDNEIFDTRYSIFEDGGAEAARVFNHEVRKARRKKRSGRRGLTKMVNG